MALTIPALAQVTSADITGRVTDQSGAAVVNATVTIRNAGTGQTRSVQTDEEGAYTVTQLPPGNYELAVEAASFSRAVSKDLQLNIGTKQTVNITLSPGQITETVEVSTGGAVVETTRSDLGGVVTPVEVDNLPLINRTFANLSVIMPEARPAGNFDPTKTRVGNVAFSGGDGRQVDVNVDGGDNKDNVVGSLLQNFSYESIQEFQVLQHRWTAEQGRAV
ncbi:MAG TPA: carboxypeptidase-like regulatory domain-containing protein, partial [Pyrinomonadaceae bacterium]|nr:carboxypeptidase-like regulatory domain-containing protein [Pyrinomonadaceae bacterium]